MPRKLTLRDIKLLQEESYDYSREWDRVSDHDKVKKEEAFNKMQKKAAECGYGLKDYWIRNGRKIK